MLVGSALGLAIADVFSGEDALMVPAYGSYTQPKFVGVQCSDVVVVVFVVLCDGDFC